jgi:hypothetical protein
VNNSFCWMQQRMDIMLHVAKWSNFCPVERSCHRNTSFTPRWLTTKKGFICKLDSSLRIVFNNNIIIWKIICIFIILLYGKYYAFS